MEPAFPTVTPMAGKVWCPIHGYYDLKDSKNGRCPACAEFNPLAILTGGG